MKVDGPERSEPAKPPPTPGQFQQALQKAAVPSALRLPADSSPSRPTSPGSPVPRLPPPPSGTAPPPTNIVRLLTSAVHPLMGTARALATALAPTPVLVSSRSTLASPENLGQARQTMHGEALRLRTARTESQTMAQEKTEHRLSELISRELSRELRVELPPQLPPRAVPPPPESSRGPAPTEGLPAEGEPRPAPHLAGMAPPDSPDPQLKVQATLQLIERIELFVQSQRPALRMNLGSPLSATVEVERTAPREVALRIQGRHGPLAQEDLARIRDALEARGLRLRSLRAE